MTLAYYNEFDPFAAEWLRELLRAGHIAPGVVDDKSILEVEQIPCFPDGERPKRVHLFAGIGGWDYALRLAGWPVDREVWTGSCPCQPFSSAGKRKGTADARHLWPEMLRLIAVHRPATIFGEQVASKAGREWFAGVRTDLEALGYAVGCADLCAACVGAPHIRQRLWWCASRLADTSSIRRHEQRAGTPFEVQGERSERSEEQSQSQRAGELSGGLERLRGAGGLEHTTGDGRQQRGAESVGRGAAERRGAGGLADASSERRQQESRSTSCNEGANGRRAQRDNQPSSDGKNAGGLGHADSARPQGRELPAGADGQQSPHQRAPWASSVLIPCGDGKARRVEPRVFPLANGVPGRVGHLRGYGNAIVPECAAVFIEAFLEAERELNL